MPGERSAASIGMLGNRARRAVVTTPLPEPLSMAVASGAEGRLLMDPRYQLFGAGAGNVLGSSGICC